MATDMHLVFVNAMLFNEPVLEVYRAGRAMRELLSSAYTSKLGVCVPPPPPRDSRAWQAVGCARRRAACVVDFVPPFSANNVMQSLFHNGMSLHIQPLSAPVSPAHQQHSLQRERPSLCERPTAHLSLSNLAMISACRRRQGAVLSVLCSTAAANGLSPYPILGCLETDARHATV